MKTRDEIEAKYKIDTTTLFENDQAFENELNSVTKAINEISKYANKLIEDNNLFECYELDERLSRRIMRLYTYAHLNNDFDLSVSKYNEYIARVIKVFEDYNSLGSYIVPELLENDYSVIEELYKKHPELKKYEIVLKDVYRCKDHTLSKSEEYLISKLCTPYGSFENAFSKLTDVDLKFGNITIDGKKEEFNEVLYYSLSENKDRNIRKKAFKKLYEGYKSIINTNAELIAGNIKKDNAVADVRKYNSALENSVLYNNIDPKVYDMLLKSIENNMDIIHKQWDVFKKVLNLKDLHLYDISAPLVENYEKKYSLEDAKELVLSSLSVMGENYVNIIKQGFDERWIDIYPNKNKRGGAYCTACYETHPYVLTNFDERLRDVSTIIHELGHAMQYFFCNKYNEYCNSGYSIFVAEVASQVNEILLNLYIINNSKDKNEVIQTYGNLLKQFKGSVVRQSMFAEFEKIIHEAEASGIALSVDYLNNTYYELNKKYYGDGVIVDEEIKYEWSRIPHFYYNFYVYQYATGYIAALKLATDLYNKKDGALERYLEFLRLGSTKDPVESLKIAGVDLTKESTFNEAFKEFDRELDEFIRLKTK